MENKDKPAYPLIADHIDGRDYKGLTKREAFAMAAMQGLLAGMDYQSMVENRATDTVGATSLAVMMADELLKQLGE